MLLFKSVFIYLATFSFSMLCAFIYQKSCKKNNYKEKPILIKMAWFLLIISAPVFVCTVRNGVGTDFYSYKNLYLLQSGISISELFKYSEPLYVLINILAKRIFGDYWGVLLLCSFIIHWFIVTAIDYYKKYVSMPIALFIFYVLLFSFSLNGYRQAIATAIVFFAFKYIIERKFFKYLLFIVIATMFHTTASVCIVFYLFAGNKIGALREKENRKNIFSGSNFVKLKNAVFYVFLALSPILLKYIINISMGISLYNKYFTDYEVNYSEGGIGFVIYLIPLVPLVFYRKQIIKEDVQYNCLFNIALMTFLFNYSGYYIAWASRLSTYSMAAYYVVIPLMFGKITKKGEKHVLFLAYLLYFLVYYVIVHIAQNSSGPYPYTTIFE